MFVRDGRPTLLDARIDGLDDASATGADQVVVVPAAVELKDGLIVIEIASADESRVLELGQDAIDGCQTDLGVLREQLSENVLGTQVALGMALQRRALSA